MKHGPSEGIYIYGLFLDGCKWDKGKGVLTDSDPKVIYSPLPVLHIAATGSVDKTKQRDTIYPCPVYRAPKRTGLNFITVSGGDSNARTLPSCPSSLAAGRRSYGTRLPSVALTRVSSHPLRRPSTSSRTRAR